jgi:hypothetical protein
LSFSFVKTTLALKQNSFGGIIFLNFLRQCYAKSSAFSTLPL